MVYNAIALFIIFLLLLLGSFKQDLSMQVK